MLKDPVVISAFITVGGMVVTVVANLLANHFQRKNDTSERFLYEVFPKRLAVYEEVITELEAMIKSGESFLNLNLTKNIAVEKISKDIHSLNYLFTRIKIFGSMQTMRIFFEVTIRAQDELTHLIQTDNHFGVIFGRWIDTVRKTLAEFVESIRKDTGGNLIDRIINKVVRTSDCRIKRILDKLFPSKLLREMKKLDTLYEKCNKDLHH